MAIDWTDKMDAVLKREWNLGTSTRDISWMIFGNHDTRQSVTNRAIRLRLGLHKNYTSRMIPDDNRLRSKEAPVHKCRYNGCDHYAYTKGGRSYGH